MSYTLSSTRLTQPLGRAEVDGSLLNPALISALFVPTMGYGMNVSPGISPRQPKLAMTGNMPQVAVKGGLGYRFSGVANEYLNVGIANEVLDNTSCTILICEQRNSSTVNTGHGYGYQIGASDRVLIHLPFTDGTVYFDYGNATAGSGRISVPGTAYISAGTVSNWAFVAGSRGREIWRNGVRIASAPAAKAVRAATVPAAEFRFGAADALGLGRSADTTITMGMVSREQLSERALAAITGNPWRLFKPQERRIWAVMGEGGGGGSSGSLNATESGSDTFAASAVVQAVPASGALTAAETGADTAVVQASAVATGALAASEQGADIASINGKATASGQLAAVEASPDTALATAGVTASGQLNAAEAGSDVFAASATTPIAGGGRLQAQEAGTDTAAVTGSAKAAGLLLAQEFGADTAIASGFAVASGALVSVEPGPDTAAISAQVHAQVAAQGRLSAVESSGDAASAFISALVSGALAAIEAGSDTFAGRESAPPAAPDALYLSIADANTHLSKASGAQHLSIARI